MAAESISGGEGSLERLGITPETQVPGGILTVGSVTSVRFHEIPSKGGYSFREVDKFVLEQVLPSLEWYAQMLHTRDVDIHRLGEEIDHIEVDNANLRIQIQNAAYNAPIRDAINRLEEDEEVVSIMQRLRDAEANLSEEQAARAAEQQAASQVEEDLTKAIEYIAQLEQYIDGLGENEPEAEVTEAEEVYEETEEPFQTEDLAEDTYENAYEEEEYTQEVEPESPVEAEPQSAAPVSQKSKAIPSWQLPDDINPDDL